MATQISPSLCVGENVEKETGIISCFRCGVCCTGRQVRLDLMEARRICDGLGLNWYVFLSNYTDPKWSGNDSYLLRQQDGACILLKNTDIPYCKVCIAHMFKPSACRDWSPSLYRRECQQGLAKYWDLTVDTDGKLHGPDEQIQRFRLFLESLTTAGGFEASEEAEVIRRYEKGRRFENRREESL